MGADQLAMYLRKTSAFGQMIYGNIMHRLARRFSPLLGDQKLKLNDGMKEPVVLFRRLSDYMDENNRNPYYFTALSNDDLTPMFDIRPQFRQLPPECAYPIDIVGLSNGVCCLWNCRWDGDYVLWNPLTDEHKSIPPSPFPRPSTGFRPLHQYPSFTFDKNSLDCKVLQDVGDGYQLYSLKRNSWKQIAQPRKCTKMNPPVSVGGVSYSSAVFFEPNYERTISAFDFEAEEFYFLPLPEPRKKSDRGRYAVTLLDYDGSLSALINSDHNYEFWVLTDGSWEKVFEAGIAGVFLPFLAKKDVLFFYRLGGNKNIVMFDMAAKVLKNLALRSDCEFPLYVYVPNKVLFTQPLFSTCSN